MTDILVTGGTGFIGSALVRALLRKGHRVRVFDNNWRGRPENLDLAEQKIDFVQGDIRNRESVIDACRGVHTVYHLAFINGTENFYLYPNTVLDVAVRGHLNILEGCQASGVEKFIYASSSEIYQTPPEIPTPENVPASIPDVQNPRYSYAGGKLIGELLTLHDQPDSKMQHLIFRPHNVYGPNMGFEHVIPQIVEKIFAASESGRAREAHITIQGSGGETRAFCFIDDAVKAILLVAEKGEDGGIYNIGVDEETPIQGLVGEIASVMGVSLEIVAGAIADGSTPRRCPDITKIRSLGFQPETTLRRGLTMTVPWYVEHFSGVGEG